MELQEIEDAELAQINGGFWEVVGVVVALCARAYQYGKDAAERERRHAW
ncbi:hypothetical protein WBJ53_23610 [Spirosoma sp. SC4-14]